jgi:hypothetical protein
MSSLLEKYEKQATLLDRRRHWDDIEKLKAINFKEWANREEKLVLGGEPLAAITSWVKLVNSDVRGLGADGLSLASFTTSAPVFPAVVFDPSFFYKGRLMHLRARGLWAATGTPTYTWRLQSTAGTVVTIVTSAAITVSALTNQPWEVDIQIRCGDSGPSGKLQAMGDLNIGGVANQPTYLPAAGTAPADVTVDTGVAQTWQLEVACSVSNAANTILGKFLELKSIN